MMLVIRKQQQQALQEYMLEQYQDRTLAHFQQFFPRHCEIIGDESMKNMIRFGVDRAKRQNISGECNVILYTSLMLLFGSYFDQDPQYPWAVRVLKDKSLTEETERAERLYDIGVQEWEHMAGPDNADLVRAIARISKLSFEELVKTSSQSLPALLKRLYPQKAERLGARAINDLLREARRRSQKYKLDPGSGHVVITAIALLFGNGFDEDPMFPWASQALDSPDLNPGERGRTLYDHAMTYAQTWLSHVGKGVA